MKPDADHITVFDNRCVAYISGIRNKHKRAYAVAYWRFRRVAEGVSYPDAEGEKISYMAGQAVRIHIENIWRDKADGDGR